jgi:hypothetical protein
VYIPMIVAGAWISNEFPALPWQMGNHGRHE